MGIDVGKYQLMKDKVEDLQREADRAEGALTQTMERLKQEFDVDSIEDAEKLQKQLEAEAEKAEEAFDNAFGQFEEKWGEVLEID